MANPISFTKTLAAASATNIAQSQSPGAGAITLNGSAVSNGVATIDTYNALTNSEPGRRVIVTSGGDDTGITFTVTGTNAGGTIISDTFAGASGGAATSSLDFVTVTAVTHTGSVAGTVTVGTNGIGASRWIALNYQGNPPMNVGFAVQLVSGSCNFTIQYTYDNPNSLPAGMSEPLAFASEDIAGASATDDGSILFPIAAIRLLVNSGTGTTRTRIIQAGIG
jgi:hypothetical protein